MTIGKKVLFISPAFFGYELDIKNAMIHNGYDVDFFDERTSNNAFLKAIFRVKKDLLKRSIEKHYQDILEYIKTKSYDYFFLIKGEVVPESFILAFKNLNPNAKLIYYTYDSFSNNNTHSIYILKHFDVCYSFDFNDVQSNPSLKLKHLFYTGDFVKKEHNTERKYELSFVGTLHSNRYSVMKKLFGFFDRTFAFYYMPARWYFYFQKITKKEFMKIDIDDVSFDKMSKQTVAEVFNASKSVLDIQRFGQSGLTMRTFEVLASGAKLVSTNKHLRAAEFYDERNIIVIDDLNDEAALKELVNRIKQPEEPLLKLNPGFEQYHVNNWVTEFFTF
jgi:hypothetical protein